MLRFIHVIYIYFISCVILGVAWVHERLSVPHFSGPALALQGPQPAVAAKGVDAGDGLDRCLDHCSRERGSEARCLCWSQERASEQGIPLL